MRKALFLFALFPTLLYAAADREAARDVVMIPVAGTVNGANDTRFQTDITLSNRSNAPVFIDVYWLPQDRTGSGQPVAQLSFTEFETKFYDDFVRATLGQSGLGAIIFRASRQSGTAGPGETLIDAYARIWTPAGEGAGTMSVGISASTLYGPKVDDFQPIAGYVYGLRQDRNFRANLGIVNMDSRPLRFTVYVNTSVVPISVLVPANSMVQRPVPSGEFGPVTLTIVPEQEIPPRLDLGPWTAYGTSVDNRSGDAWFSKAQSERLHQDR